MQREQQSNPQRRPRRWTGLGQLTLVEHSLGPLDPAASLVENLIHESAYFYTDRHRHLCQARARIISPSGLSAADEFYLWGLLALTFAQPQADANLFATPHYCLRQLGLIDQNARRAGRQYQQFGNAIERLSQVTYLNDRFYDPVRAEHRKVSFGFLSYSLPLDPESSRAWRIAWDPIFYELVRAAGGSFHFDLATYRELDPASRRLFLLLSKILSRRSTSPPFEVRHLAVNVLGFSSSIDVRDLKMKIWRCAERLHELGVVRLLNKATAFRKTKRGEYSIAFERGDYFARRRQATSLADASDSAVHELLQQLGFEGDGIVRLTREFSAPLLREWVDIAQAAKERFGQTFFKKSIQAYLIDNLKHAAKGKRTPPDWWHEVRKAENQRRLPTGSKPVPMAIGATPEFSDETRQTYEQIVTEMFAVFRAGGQPEELAQATAEKFARECVQRELLAPGGSPVRILKTTGN